MYRVKRVFQLIILLAIAGVILLEPAVSRSAVRSAMELCCTIILPTLFPFMVLTKIWTALGYHVQIQHRIGKLMAMLFHLPAATSPWILGMVGGYPIGAQIITQLYQEKQLTKQEACQMLLFCCNPGLAFVFGAAGTGIFGSVILALALECIVLVSSILIGIFFRPKSIVGTELRTEDTQQIGIISAFIEALPSCCETLLQICGFILLFSLLQFHIQNWLPTSIPTMLLLAAMELTEGISILTDLSIPLHIKFILTAALSGWGGLCVVFQTCSILNRAQLPVRPYVIGKLAQSVCCAGISILLLPLLPKDLPCLTINRIKLFPSLPFILLLVLLVKSFSGKSNENPL